MLHVSHRPIACNTAPIMVAHAEHAQKVTTVSECVAPQAAIHAGGLCAATVATIGDAMTTTYAVSGEDGLVAGFPLVSPAWVMILHVHLELLILRWWCKQLHT